MNKSDILSKILFGKSRTPHLEKGSVYAPANIALCKYWGKRNEILNLPMTSSLSISLQEKGSHFAFEVIDTEDALHLNEKIIPAEDPFYQSLFSFINLFRNGGHPRLHIRIHSTIPIAAGLASSASGFASVVKGLDALYGWQLAPHELSILARLGSGSACRSIWSGFVEWQKGIREDGMDSFGVPLDLTWPALRIGLLLVSCDKKNISSRKAMALTQENSPLYRAWPQQVAQELDAIKRALANQDFMALGEASESNAMVMHKTMMATTPSIDYSTPKTREYVQQIWQLRREGLPIYFTQDAGPNLKLLFLENMTADVLPLFPQIEIIKPFA